MNTVKFQRTIHDGVITLHGHQELWNDKKIRVILLDEADLKTTEVSTDQSVFDADFVGFWKRRDINQKSIHTKARWESKRSHLIFERGL